MSASIKLWFLRGIRAWKSVALDFAALLFMASVLMTYLISQDFVIGRVCRVDLGYPEAVCEAVVQNKGNYTQEESNIQKIVAQIRRTRAFIDYSIPILFVLIQGSWSDIHGRKLPLLLPCIGFAIQALTLAMAYFFQSWGGFTIVLMSAIPKNLSGSDVTFRMAALSHVSDTSTKQSRTLRTGLMSAALTLGVPLGFALGGATAKAAIKAEIAFLISAGICMISFLTILIFVDNAPSICENDKDSDKGQSRATKSSKKKFLSRDTVRDVMKSLVLSFHGVSKRDRIQIIVLVCAIICINAPIQGEFGVMYLYLRKKLGWDSVDYGLFSTYVSLIGVIGTMISMGLFCSILKLSDPLIGFIAGFSQFGGCFMYAYAYKTWMIYLAPAIDMFNGTMSVVAKSMLSKLCPPDDVGKMFSFLAVVELVVPFFFDPTYSSLYEHTLDTLPGSVFLLSAVLTVPPQITYLFYLWRDRSSQSCKITMNSTDDVHTSNINSAQKVTTDKKDSLHVSSVTLKSVSSTMTLDSVLG